MIKYFADLFNVFLKSQEIDLMDRKARSVIISALRDAIRYTKIHIKNYRIGEFGEQNFQDVESFELVSKWSEVARLIRPYDPSLAKTLEDKSDYWTDPHQFRLEVQNDERRWTYSMRLDEVERELAELERNY